MSDTIVSITYALIVGGILLFIIMRYLAHKRVPGGGGAKAALVQRQKSISRNAKHISDSLGLKSDDIVTISHDMVRLILFFIFPNRASNMLVQGFNERDFEVIKCFTEITSSVYLLSCVQNFEEENILRGKLSALCRDFLLEHRILFHATSAGKTAIIRQLNSTLHLDGTAS